MGVFSEREQQAWRWPEKLTPSEWAEKHRCLLPPAPETGPYSFVRTPYAKGIHDAFVEPGIEEIVVLKCTRVGFTTTTQNLIGYCVSSDPGPILLVMPSEDAALDMMEGSLIPLCEQTPELTKHLSGEIRDVKKHSVKFDNCSIQVGWAGSPQSLASKEIRYVVLDEVDKYPPFSGREADPISLARERTKTYLHRKRLLIGSTPTTRDGAIWRAWEDCGDRRQYHVPCPYCGEYQTLVYTQIKKPKLDDITDRVKLADTIKVQQLAWYECQHCKGQIRESQKMKMLGAGIWLPETQTIDRSGAISGIRQATPRVGFQLNTIYSPWTSFSDVLAEGIRAEGDRGRMMNFRNSWLGQVFEEQISSVHVGDIRKKAEGSTAKPYVVPKWCGLLTSTVDVQKDRFYWVTRGWGADYRSQLIAFGVAFSFDELKKLALDTPFPIEGTNEVLTPSVLLADSGYRKDDVVKFAQSDARVLCTKGASGKTFQPYRFSKAFHQYGVRLAILDTEVFKDRLHTWIKEDRWQVHNQITDEYCQHMASEHKIVIKGKGRIQYRWDTVTQGAANHFWDCEVYQAAAADICNVWMVPDEVGLEAQRQARIQQQQKKQQPQQSKKQGWITTSGKGWLK